jgi:choloylglycine hydrolase
MCTAISHNKLFGRNLDLEYGYDERVVITPRNYPLIFRRAGTFHPHNAIIGMAAVDQSYPLYFDAMNEHGLCMAGLDFPGNAYYPPERPDLLNIAPFELIPWVLCQCSNVHEARELLRSTHLADICYNANFPQAPLHWIIADKNDCIVLEPTKYCLQIYENPIGVLCNNPPFPYHLHHLAGFQHLSAGERPPLFENVSLKPYGGGLGAIGLPGDFSSPSRFVKAAFVKCHSHYSEGQHITQFFHLLDAVAMPRGSVRVRENRDEITRYSCCCDMDTGNYYYTTYDNRRIQSVRLNRSNLDGSEIEQYSLLNQQDIFYKN